MEYLKIDRAVFPRKIPFLPKFLQKLPQKAPKWSWVFWKFLLLVLLWNDLKWYISPSGKNVILKKLLAKMLLANQIAGFFKMYCLKKEVNDEVAFCMQMSMKVSFLWIDSMIFDGDGQAFRKHYRFRWKWPDMSKVPKIGSW